MHMVTAVLLVNVHPVRVAVLEEDMDNPPP